MRWSSIGSSRWKWKALLANTAVASIDGVTAALDPSAVERIGMGEPEWLRERRMHAWDVYERTPMPTE